MMQRIRIQAIVLLALLIAAGATAHAQGRPRGYYVGTIGKGNPITLKIDPIDDLNVGSYCYQNVGSRIWLSGTITPAGAFTLAEYDEHRNRTGTITGATSPRGDTIRGEWRNPAGTRRQPLLAVRVAEVDSIVSSRRIGIYRGTFTARFPVVRLHPGASAAVISNAIRAVVAAEEQLAYAGLQQMAGDSPGSDAGEPEFQFGTTLTYDLALYNAGFVTLDGHAEYFGGAHPSYAFPNMNLAVSGSQVRAITRSDLFGADASFARRIGSMLYDALKRSKYPCLEQLDRGMMAETEFTDNFLVAGKGLVYRTWPGPHACGPARDIVVPYAKVRDLLRRGGAVEPLLKAER